MTLNPDGSEDNELKIKGIPDIEISDYSHKDLPNQEDEAEEALALAGAADGQRKEEAQRLCQADVAAVSQDNEEASNSDEGLLRAPSQRVKHRPGWQAKDCYFTAEEAEVGDPLVVDDPA